MLTRSLAAEWGKYGITVNAIGPGWFPSRLTRGVLAQHGDALAGRTALGRLGGADDLKGAALLLASDAGGHITGQTIFVDGGASRFSERSKQMTEVFIVSGVRTAIGDFGGALKDMAPTALGAQVVRAALERAGVAGAEVGHVVFGHVIHTEPRDMYMARVAALDAGVAQETPALTVNRLCGSGPAGDRLGRAEHPARRCRHRGGRRGESMSRAPYMAQGMRWGARMGDSAMVDMMVARAARPVRQHPHGR